MDFNCDVINIWKDQGMYAWIDGWMDAIGWYENLKKSYNKPI